MNNTEYGTLVLLPRIPTSMNAPNADISKQPWLGSVLTAKQKWKWGIDMRKEKWTIVAHLEYHEVGTYGIDWAMRKRTETIVGRVLCSQCGRPMELMWEEKNENQRVTIFHCWHCDIDRKLVKETDDSGREIVVSDQQYFFGWWFSPRAYNVPFTFRRASNRHPALWLAKTDVG